MPRYRDGEQFIQRLEDHEVFIAALERAGDEGSADLVAANMARLILVD